MNRSVVKNLAWDVGAATSVALLPLAIYLKHNDYPLANPETILLLAVVVLAGLFWGGVMSLGRMPGRFLVLLFLAILTVDIQTHWITTWGLRLLLNVLFFSVLFWFLRKRLSQVILVLAGAMLLGTLVTPGTDQMRTAGTPQSEPVKGSDLPFILHLVLDEHIGIEGFPRQFDPDRAVANQVRDSYVDKGFLVFGRAYSNYYYTIMSLANLLNFTHSDDPQTYLPYPFDYTQVLADNAWFELLSDKGYRIHVFQTEYFSYVDDLAFGGDRQVASSVTLPGNSIFPLAPVAMPVADKARFIMSNYMRLSWILSSMRGAYRGLRVSSLGQIIGLPIWDLSGERLSTLTSMNAVELLESDLEFAGPGQAFFVHLLLPHFPYAYDRDCEILDMEETWLDWEDPAKAPDKNDAESRALRYRAYREQYICSNHKIQMVLEELSRRPWWDEAIVVVHGDHGSRIDLMKPQAAARDNFTGQGLMDGFSTLFAIKMPGLTPGYDRRQLPIGHLFKRLLRDGVDPGDPDWESRPRVLVTDGTNPLLGVDLPFFDHGLPREKDATGSERESGPASDSSSGIR